MRKVCNLDIENLKKVHKDLKKFLKRLKSLPNVKEVYVYGSFAKGDVHEGSDIDLIVVGDFEGRIFDRIGKITQMTDLPIEPLVYTEEEFDAMKKSGNIFLKGALKDAKRITAKTQNYRKNTKYHKNAKTRSDTKDTKP